MHTVRRRPPRVSRWDMGWEERCQDFSNFDMSVSLNHWYLQGHISGFSIFSLAVSYRDFSLLLYHFSDSIINMILNLLTH